MEKLSWAKDRARAKALVDSDSRTATTNTERSSPHLPQREEMHSSRWMTLE